MKQERAIDLDGGQYRMLKRIIETHIPHTEVWAYGSRVKWNASVGADLDLVVFGCDFSTIAIFREALEKSSLAISVDVMNWEKIPDDFKENIKRKYVIVHKKLLPVGWQDIKLVDAADITMGQSPPGNTYNEIGLGIPFYQGVVDFGERYVTPRVYTTSPKKTAEAGDILLSVRAPVGRVNLTKEKCSIGRGNAALRAKKGVQNYLYYLLKSSQKRLDSQSSGTIFNSVIKYDIDNIKVLLPPLTEQESITEVLSNLDNKIDIFRRQNKILETTARAFYKKLFIKDVGNNWEETPLESFLDFLEGPGIRNWQYTKTGTRFINIRLMREGEIDTFKSNFVSDEEANTKYKHFQLQEKDMIVSTSATLGKTAIIRDYHLPLLLNTSVISFKPKDGVNYSFMYQYLQSMEFQSQIRALGGGSVQTNFGPTHLKTMKIKIPSSESLSKYRKYTDDIYIKISNNFSQIRAIEKMRDTLLPKLLNGKIKLKVKP